MDDDQEQRPDPVDEQLAAALAAKVIQDAQRLAAVWPLIPGYGSEKK